MELEFTIPKAASSMELPWPITAVSMRLINGPQIQSPVAGPVNITISFICFHIFSLPNSETFSSSSSPETETISISGPMLSLPMSSLLLLLMREAVTIRFRKLFFGVEMSDKLEWKREMGKRGGGGGGCGGLLEKKVGFWKRGVLWDVRVLNCIFWIGNGNKRRKLELNYQEKEKGRRRERKRERLTLLQSLQHRWGGEWLRKRVVVCFLCWVFETKHVEPEQALAVFS